MYGENEVRLPHFTGHIARGLLLQAIRNVDPSVSQALHSPNVRKAYAVTPLWFRSKGKVGSDYILDPRHPCYVGVRFLADEYAKILLSGFESRKGFLIYDTKFRVSSIKVRTKSYKDMWSEATPVKSLRLCFKTPTCFAALGRPFYSLYPEPKKVFGNLMDLWNLHSDEEVLCPSAKEEFLKWLGKAVGVSGYSLETRIEPTGKGKTIGFVGWVAYRMNNDERWSRFANCLSQLSTFSNVGKNRTAGFGVMSVSTTQFDASLTPNNHKASNCT